jgi:hypothetical protein
MNHKTECNEITLEITHKWGKGTASLDQWIALGPGEDERSAFPSAAKCADNGQDLPLSVIPMRYRNTPLSNLLIRLKLIPDPWQQWSKARSLERPNSAAG